MDPKAKRVLSVTAIAVIYGLIMWALFNIDSFDDLFKVMSITFLFMVPGIIGAIMVYFSNIERARRLGYRILAPWIPVLLFMVITLGFSLEGWACWIMVLPLFLISASIGGLIGGRFKMDKEDKKGKVYMSLLVLLPVILAPLENLVGEIPGTYKAYTYIDINSSAEDIWQNVTRVPEIPAAQDKGWLTRFLGFPRPVRAELNYEGVGAYRDAIFSKGLVFHETVLSYADKQKMVFSIKANPYDIPSTTMDEHVVIGGDYFDVLNGTYELEKLAEGRYRLHLYSHFKLTTTFNFYASWWARWIMKDIQNNILQVIKQRAEKAIP